MRFNAVFGVLLLAVTTVGAQVIFNYTQPWRYDANGLELGTEWRSLSYDDSHWPTGLGVFATTNEPLLDGATRGTQMFTSVSNRYVTNFYFRTVLLRAQVPAGHVLYATNQIDDGAVVYFNGAEVGRTAMPPGNPTANTLATRLDDVSFHGLEVLRMETTNLLGTNVLCAEVHQGSGVGGDMVWGMKLATVPAPVQITSPPQSQSLVAGSSVVFAVGVDGGGPIFFQWRKDDVVIPEATNATLALSGVQPADAGNYSVIVSNALAWTISSNANLSVGCGAAPTISTEPLGQTLPAGSGFTLSVNTSGTMPFTYQWFRNASPLTGATNQTYTRTSAATEDSGLYSVRVANCAGSQQSSNAVVVVIAPSSVLVPDAQVWKYEQSGSDLGTVWRLPSYDDASWPAGPGIFGFPTNENTLGGTVRTEINRFVPGSQIQILTYYFRTLFNFTNEPGTVSLIFSNRIDDGVVFYLNGQEIRRIAMPSNAVTAQTFATRSDDITTHGIEVFTIPSDDVLPGVNLLAAEVHQANFTSADAIFGTIVSVQVPPPTLLAITNQPLDQAVEEAKSATFTAGVSGTGARLQWFRNGVPMPGATRASLTITNVTGADAGWYALRASNAVSVVFSRLARLDVLVDVTAPRLLSGDILDDTTVLLGFSEPITVSSATNRQNYLITNTIGGSFITVLGITPTNGTNVLLRTSPMVPDRNYIARVNGIRDTSLNTNIIVLNSSVPLARTVTLVPFDAVWDFYDPFVFFGDNPDPGPAWTEVDFTRPVNWGTGVGSFLFDLISAEAPVPVNTALSQTDTIASYFRHPFTAEASRGGLRLSLRHAVDDGAIFYLNGAEIARFNMSAASVTHTSAASLATTSFLLRDAGQVPSASFRAGSNVFAAELHQIAVPDEDKLFSAELRARIESGVLGPVIVTGGPEDRIVMEGEPVEFSATTVGADGFQWQCCGTAILTATNIPGATNPVYRIERTPLSLDGEKFRLRVSNSNSSINTTGATLRVLADTTPPALVAARLSNGVITVTFSEPVTAATATNLLNFAVTNLNGEVLVITGATLLNETNVLLSFTGSLAGFYVVGVNGVTDTAAVSNVISTGSAVTIGADFFIQMNSAWKYLLINTNEVVQTTFFAPSYDDSFWEGPSNALLYVESAGLPGPKNTYLSLVDDTGVNRINTFYFRKSVVPSISGVPALLRIRHIIDDGLVLYLNGLEVYRFNIRAGPVTAATQGTVSVADATLQGPFEVWVTNLVAGTNVLAAEVHQIGAESSDVVFGVELSASIASAPLIATRSSQRVTLVRWAGEFAIEWQADGTLECSDGVTGPWQEVTSTSPHFVSPTNAAAFYRVRQ